MNIKHLNEISFFEKFGFLYLIVDKQLNVISASENWRSLLNNESIAITNIKDVIASTYLDKVNDLIENIRNNHLPQPTRLKLIHEDEKWLECRLQAAGSNNQNNFVLLFTDVTPQHIRAQKRKNIITLFKQASADLNIGYWQYNVKTGRLFWSDEVYNMHHVVKGDFTPTLESAIAFYHRDDADLIQENIEKAIVFSEGWQQLQLRIITADNALKTIVSSAEVTINEYGEVNEIIGFVHDVSQHVKRRRELDFMATAMIETSVGMAIAAPNRTILWVNRAFENMTGYLLEEIKSKPLGPILQGPKTCPNTINTIRDHLNAGKSIKTRILNYHANGNPYWNELTISPIYRNNHLAYFFAVQNDVTTEVLASQKLEKLNSSLEKQVLERTKELTQLNKDLAIAANKDPLTGCMNRRNLKPAYLKALAELKYNQHICLILIDIDYFKKINDLHGHLAGDKVLESVANALSHTVGLSNRLFRFGGEEFLIIVSNKSKAQLEQLLALLKDDICQLNIIYEGKKIPVTISLGAAYHDGKNSLDTSIKVADKNLYQAKENGRNQFVISPLDANP